VQFHKPFSILGRLFGVGGVEFAFRARDCAKVSLYVAQGFGFIKFASKDKNGVVGLIVSLVEISKILNRHTFNIASVTDRIFSVIVPHVGHGTHTNAEQVGGRVLAPIAKSQIHFIDLRGTKVTAAGSPPAVASTGILRPTEGCPSQLRTNRRMTDLSPPNSITG